MACEIKPEPYWICARFPWGCNKQHATKEEAEQCEKRKPTSYTGHSEAKAYLKENEEPA